MVARVQAAASLGLIGIGGGGGRSGREGWAPRCWMHSARRSHCRQFQLCRWTEIGHDLTESDLAVETFTLLDGELLKLVAVKNL